MPAPLPAASKRQLAAGPVAQWLEPAAHNGLVAGSSPAGPTKEISDVRTTKERLDFTLRTTRSAPLRTTRFRHPFEFVRQFWSDFVLLDTGRVVSVHSPFSSLCRLLESRVTEGSARGEFR